MCSVSWLRSIIGSGGTVSIRYRDLDQLDDLLRRLEQALKTNLRQADVSRLALSRFQICFQLRACSASLKALRLAGS